MAKDVSDTVGRALGNAARDIAKGASSTGRSNRSGGGLPVGKGLAAGAAGAGLMALAPLAGKGVSKLAGASHNGVAKLRNAGEGALADATTKVKDNVKTTAKVKDDLKSSIPGGKGRRVPVQQDIDIGVPLTTVYNQFTQFEEWPEFMHRVQELSQDDESHVKFKTKIWGKSKEFAAEILEQRPDERIVWKLTEGMTHAGVVTFHELGPRLTRVEVNLDVDPRSLPEKAARGMRYVKRAVRADLARFKAYVLMHDDASGAWRGEIEDGEVKSKSSARGGQRTGGRGQSSTRGHASGRGQSSRRSRSGSSSSDSSPARPSSASRSASSRNSGGSSSSGRGRASSNGRSRSSSARRSSANGGSSGSSGSRSPRGTRASSASSSR
jgi:uncharacterized membrane protein